MSYVILCLKFRHWLFLPLVSLQQDKIFYWNFLLFLLSQRNLLISLPIINYNFVKAKKEINISVKTLFKSSEYVIIINKTATFTEEDGRNDNRRKNIETSRIAGRFTKRTCKSNKHWPCSIESNRKRKTLRAPGEEIKAIADYFNVSADYLLDRETPKTPTLSNEQTAMLNIFDTLNPTGQNALPAVLNGLSVAFPAREAAVWKTLQGGGNFFRRRAARRR